MKLEDQVCSLEQAERLKKLGVHHPSPLFYWVDETAWRRGYQVQWCKDAEYRGKETKGISFTDFDTTHPAFTVAELGVMYNSENYTVRHGSEQSEYANWSWLNDGNNEGMGPYATEAEARADCLIRAIEKGEVYLEEVNARLTSQSK